MFKIIRRLIYFLVFVAVMIFLFAQLFSFPSNDRDWSPDQAKLPSAEVNGDKVLIHDVRNFTYTSVDAYTPGYYDKTYDLSKIKKVYYVVEPFSGVTGSAHTFLSFEFEGNVFVSISIEIRKERGETFSAIMGLLNKYELMYVIADEKDVIKLRTNYRHDQVYLYPMRATTDQARALFLDMVTRANYLKDHPEFYNTLWNTCTTNILEHVNRISTKKIPRNYKVLFPAYSDQLAYDLGLIDTDLSFDGTRARYLITAKAQKYANDPNFSVKIRGPL